MSIKRAVTLVAAFIVCAQCISIYGQTSRTPSPDALVRELYRVHNQKHSPFFQTRSRALLYKYFEKNLADMIWKDAVKSKGEVGVLDADPLYDAQDIKIKHFTIAGPRYESNRALVDANFENFGQKKTITFIVVKGPTGWRIRDILYGEGRTLTSEFKQSTISYSFR
ncbi:MAG: hypothetical protein ABR607_12660 [Pyrinomonadaceae bacterium]